MAKNKAPRIIAIILAVCAVAMAVVGVINLPKRSGEAGQEIVQTLRIRTLLDATGEGLVETYVDIAKTDARAKVQAEAKAAGKKASMADIKAAVTAAEEETRAMYENQETDYSAIDTTQLETAVNAYAAKLAAYEALAQQAEQVYIDANMAAAKAKAEADRQAKIDAGIEVGEEEEVTVDMKNYSKFVSICSDLTVENVNLATEAADKLKTAQAEAKTAYAPVAQSIEALLEDAGDVRADVDALIAAGSENLAIDVAKMLHEKAAAQEEPAEVGADLAALTEALTGYADKQQALTAVQQETDAVYAQTGVDKLLAICPDINLRDMPGVLDVVKQLNDAQAAADETYTTVGDALKGIYPVLDDSALKTLKKSLTSIIYQRGDDFTTCYDRYMEAGSGAALDNSTSAWMIRHADDLLYGALALLVAAAVVLFYGTLSKKLGIPRIVLGVFFILLCFMCLWYDLSLSALLSNSLVRMGMNSIMVLAMVPGIQCGISLNLGLPIGLVAGLIGGLVTIEWGIPGVWGFLVAIAVGVVIAAVCGWLYSMLLNRLKGEEMSVTTYVGFSIVSLMCIAWLVLPFTSLKLRWPMGTGLRNTIGLDSTNFKHILDDFLAFEIGDFVVPTGLLLLMVLCCFLVWLFTRSKTGVAMSAAGNNPRFAEATGINVDKMRVIGTVLSTVLGAVGILVYSQSYGFMQLYTAPRQMGFIAASAILIGGASTSRCKISHVLIGTFLFQGVLTLGMPVANVLVPGSTISETLRILISNGIILYALTKSGGGSRG